MRGLAYDFQDIRIQQEPFVHAIFHIPYIYPVRLLSTFHRRENSRRTGPPRSAFLLRLSEYRDERRFHCLPDEHARRLLSQVCSVSFTGPRGRDTDNSRSGAFTYQTPASRTIFPAISSPHPVAIAIRKRSPLLTAPPLSAPVQGPGRGLRVNRIESRIS